MRDPIVASTDLPNNVYRNGNLHFVNCWISNLELTTLCRSLHMASVLILYYYNSTLYTANLTLTRVCDKNYHV